MLPLTRTTLPSYDRALPYDGKSYMAPARVASHAKVPPAAVSARVRKGRWKLFALWKLRVQNILAPKKRTCCLELKNV